LIIDDCNHTGVNVVEIDNGIEEIESLESDCEEYILFQRVIFACFHLNTLNNNSIYILLKAP